MKKITKSLILLICLLFIFSATGIGSEYNEAPMLKEKVERGELSPVDERLPEDPLVLKPIHEIGKYGGTWNRLTTWDAWYGLRTSMAGFSLLRWVDDGLDKAPNLLTDWIPNEDKSIWILKFRKGVKWSDGAPFSADDFLFWWEDMVLDKEHSEVVPNWAIINGQTMDVKKIDQYTIELHLAGPQVLLPDQLAARVDGGTFEFRPAPKHYLSKFHPKYNSEYETYEAMEEKQEWWNNPECPVLTAWMPVRHVPGELLELERNPYYYAVDPEGNQLPYIDRVRVQCVSDREVYKLMALRGKTDMQVRPGFSLRDISMLKENEDQYNYKLLFYDTGSGTGPCFIFNHNFPDQEKASIYQNKYFARAVSHAIDREKIRKMVFYGQGELTTGSISPKTPQFHTERGKVIYEKLKNLALEYNPEKAKEMLDQINLIDQNGDGWRDLPSGKEFVISIDTTAASASSRTNMDTIEITKTNWEAIGIKVKINTVDHNVFSVLTTNAEFDVWVYGISENRPLLYPNALVPLDNHHHAPLYGVWNSLKGTKTIETELDKAARDRTPPRAEPAPDSHYAKLYDLYKNALATTDDQERDNLIYEIFEIHIEEGPFFIGTVANTPNIGLVKKNFKNVPSRDELALGGITAPWFMNYSAILNPSTFYIDEE